MNKLAWFGLISLIAIVLTPSLATPSQYLAGIGITFTDNVSIGDTINVNFTNNNLNMNGNNITNLSYINSGGNKTLIINAWNTGDVLNKEYDLELGNGGGYGALEIGDLEIFMSSLNVGGFNLNGSAIFRNEFVGTAINQFIFVTDSNQVRFVIPSAGSNLGTYNTRSMMIGGDLGSEFNNNLTLCAEQGYNKIDCNTSTTGADLGIQDDVQIRGELFIDSMEGSYSNGEAYVCVLDNGTLFSKDSACS